ncbi:MAG: hypothetical protein ABJA60_11280, partial [Nitrosospira sp.]
MTRTTYLAPGVYVEEIPSARQPIAGVGTNTAAFIGLVPDTLYYPVPNDDYDPVAARDAYKTQLGTPGAEGSVAEKPDAKLARLEGELQDLKNKLASATADDDKRAFTKQVKDKQQEVTAAQKE